MLSCSPRLRRGEQLSWARNGKETWSNNANVSISTTLKNDSTEGSSCKSLNSSTPAFTLLLVGYNNR
jgi:hypothetical protein